ncbi:KR-domain-containing protein [Aspergillus campestris IBT 28561]|uniref:KR-domain-containing protein n=1 Tax=Aspergillus campestris (strain IBT 28561) TaxID=1392248 RepID=A0A2I1D5G4_ASPC2|nr:KR-domain-containing protein [Aspergillus campestris IBT 28561]PKY05111.1 KR-domain-containing protein [Aspergillus campestris IBT 28561]
MEAHWRNIIRISEMPWVQDHRINNAILYPAAGMVVMAIEAIKQLADPDRSIAGFTVKDCKFISPIHIPTHSDGVETNIHVKRVKDGKSDSSGWHDFRICCYDKDTWVENCTGSIQVSYESNESGMNTNGRENAEWHASLMRAYHEAARSCAASVDTKKFYEELIEYGYQYGPAFAAITALTRNNASSQHLVSKIRTFVGTSAKDSQVVQPHTIHPTTLDAVIHMMTAMVMKVAGQEESVAVPTQIEKLWISNTGGLSYPHAHAIKAYANSDGSTVTDSRYSMIAFDEGLTKSLLNLEGLRVTNIANSIERNSEGDFLADNLCHHVEWKPDMDLLNNAETNVFCSSTELHSDEPVDAFTELDFLVSTYVNKVPASALEKAKMIGSPHMTKYAEWIARQQDILSSEQPAFNSQEWKVRLEDASFINGLHERIENGSKRGLLTSIVCKNLMQFISGENGPVSVLFEGNLLQDTYSEMASIPYHQTTSGKQLLTYIDALAHKDPAMKFIELGAGSGAMTDFCMRTLTTDDSGQTKPSRYRQWDFTDPSSSFLPQAQDLFAAQGERMRFMTLDIEQDPAIQGFECGTYDVVVAFLVIHATENLAVSLKNARKLLRPGGRFLLFEITRPDAIRTTFVFGLFDGWWRGQETYRTMNPCVDEAKWDELLKEAGYSGCDVVVTDYNDERCHECSMIVSTAVIDEPTRPSHPAINIILNPLSTVQLKLAARLSKLLQNAGIDNITQLTFQDCLSNKVTPDALSICLLETQDEFLYDIDELDFINFRDLLTHTRSLLWVDGGGGHQPNPKFRLIDGLFRVISDENQNTRLTILSLEPISTAEHQAEQILKIVTSIMGDMDKHLDTEYVEIDGMLHVGRLVHASSLNQEVATKKLPQQTETRTFGGDLPLRLEVGTPGLLNTLHFVEDKRMQAPLKPNEIEIRSKAVGLNFRDVLIALGRLNSNTLGGEFAGEVTRVGDECHKFKPGDRVVVYHPSHYANYVRVREDMAVIKIPGDWLSFVDAAAMPVTYGTAWLTLNRIAQLQRGESVLIHSGAGGTGQTAIRIAQYLGATIFTTVSSESKKQFLMDQYNIPGEHIFSSRNTLFAKGIRRLTGNKGVDVVLNSLASDEFIASWESIAPYGLFVEIGKNDILSNSKLPMGQFEKNVSFSAFDLVAMSVDRPQLVISALEEVFDLIEGRKLPVPQSAQIYEVGEIEQAFRQMQSGKNMGKAVIELRDDDQVEAVMDTKPTYAFDPNATYVISGGLGGLGRSITRWLVDRGARNLILLSRSGDKNPYARDFVAELQEQGTSAVTPACNIADRASLAAVLESCTADMPPIKGCIQASMVVSNSHFEQLTLDSWRASTAPKAQGSWNLHELLPRGLDFFVLMSSVAGISGARGESGYAAGNTFKDGLARYRIEIGEKAVALDLGLFLSAGFFKENEEARKRFLANTVLHPITESDLHALLDIYCNPSLTYIPIENSQAVVGIQPKVREMGMNTTEWMQRPLFRHLAAHEPSSSSTTNPTSNTNFAAVFATAKSLDEVTAILKQEMRSKLSRMLSISSDEIDLDKPIHQYGVDSLAAVELRNWFGRELRADIAIFDILGGASIASVVALAVGKSDYHRG